MYQYDAYDRALARARVAQFRDQVARWRRGALSDEDFRPLRLQNGLYVMRHAPMLRIAIPYGVLSSRQLRALAAIARDFDKAYGHFTTRQDFQLNWVRVEDVPDILRRLAEVDMHAIQTSGNCIRNITTDALAGVAADEAVDPRPLAELLRQWSSFHPEFAYLPRKFKFALSGAAEDRALTWFHDVGIHLARDAAGEISLRFIVGGGLGRTPMRGQAIRESLHWRHLLSYSEAILRVYNRLGRRDKPYKARLKILVEQLGAAEFGRRVDNEWSRLVDGPLTLTETEYRRVASCCLPALGIDDDPAASAARWRTRRAADKTFDAWCARSVKLQRIAGRAAVTLSLKATGATPGDADAAALDAVAGWADRFGGGEIRVTHEQNLLLPNVPLGHLFALWQEAQSAGLATPNVGLLTDVICCPGGDLCDLANARSIPVAQAILRRFDDPATLRDIGEIDLNISGCVNACGHHHVGHIGILGVDKGDREFFQVTLGGRQGHAAQVGKVIGPAFAAAEIPRVIDLLVTFYRAQRQAGERFIDTFDRLGLAAFKQHIDARRQAERAAPLPEAV